PRLATPWGCPRQASARLERVVSKNCERSSTNLKTVMSPEDLLNCSESDLERTVALGSREDLQNLFNAIWEYVRPLYAGQPKSNESAHGLSLSQVALRLASQVQDNRLLIEAWHMMGRSLGANEEFEQAIPFYEKTIAALQDAGDLQQAARLHLA